MLRPFFPELVMSTDLWVSNIPRYFYFPFHHYPCATAGGQVVLEGTCRVVFFYETPKKGSQHSGWNGAHYKKVSNCLPSDTGKSSDIEQQPPFGDRKYSNTLPLNVHFVGWYMLGKPKESWGRSWTGIYPKLIMGVTSYSTVISICQIIPSSPWKFGFSSRYIITQISPT